MDTRVRILLLFTVNIIALFASAEESPSWQTYIAGPGRRQVLPVRILSASGNVTNPTGLLGLGGITTLSRPSLDSVVPNVVIDFGKNIVGYPQITFASASSNFPGIRLAFSETTQYLTNVSDFTRSYNGDTITPGTDQYGVPPYPNTWIDTHGCLHNNSVCADGLHGFRYMRLSLDALHSDAPWAVPYGEIQISAVSLNFTAFIGTPETYTGWFESSDQELNQFWYNAAYTNELVTDVFRSSEVEPRNAANGNLEGKLVLFDGAKRDRDPYVGDIGVSARTLYLTHHFAEEAARNVLEDLANHQRADGWIPPASINNYGLTLFDYPLWWVIASWDYILYTGNTSYGKSFYPNLVKVLDGWCTHVTDSSGLLSKGQNGTSGYGDYAFLPRTGQVTYYNALYVLALNDGANIARAVGEEVGAASRWEQRAGVVKGAINAHLWDANVGAYLDSSSGAVRHGQDGIGMAIIAGVADLDRATSALNYLAKHTQLPYGNAFMDNDSLVPDGSTRVYAFTSYFDIQARFMSSQTTSALDEIRRLYGWMTRHDPNITFWEGIGAGGSKYSGPYTSAAHGWSTGVLPALTNFVLGALPTTPGYQTWSVKPHVGDLEWARGQLPTPYGPLYVNWTNSEANEKVTIVVISPSGTNGTISVPMAKPIVVVVVDGQLAWDGDKTLAYEAKPDEMGYLTLSIVTNGVHVVEGYALDGKE